MSIVEPYGFEVGGERFALERRFVEGVTTVEDMVALPLAPPVLLGAAYWRGAFVPVVRTLELLGRSADVSPGSLVVLSHAGRSLALSVAAVTGGAETVELPAAVGQTGVERGQVRLRSSGRDEADAVWLDAPALIDAAGPALTPRGGNTGQS